MGNGAGRRLNLGKLRRFVVVAVRIDVGVVVVVDDAASECTSQPTSAMELTTETVLDSDSVAVG